MRQGLRRTIGLGGAAFVAVGAALVLTLPASAHNPTWTAACNSDGKVIVNLSLNAYVDTPDALGNTVGVTDDSGNIVIASHGFGKTDNSASAPLAGNKGYTFTMTIFAQDDPNGKHGNKTGPGQFDGTFKLKTYACDNGGHPTTTTCPPTTTTTKAPPTTTTSRKPPPTTTTTKPTTTTTAGSTTTTTTAVVAAATTAAPAGTLPFTGVNAGFPLLIAGVLVVAGGGILLWLRLAAKRRRTES